MRKIIVGMMAIVIAAVSVQAAVARMKDNANFGYCKSGQKVANTKDCKENGGTK